MKRNNPQSDTAVRDFPSFKNLESLTAAAALPAAQWQQYADNASRFAAEWAHEMDEEGEAHSFWDEFLQIFNIRRRQFARHEARAKRSDNRRGFIDLFWPGKLLVEHKAGHKNPGATFAVALEQAMDYIGELEAKDRPQQLILCNFKTFQIYDAPNVLPNPSSAGKTTLPDWGSAVQFHGKTSEVFKTSEVCGTALNTPPKKRSPNLAPALQAFPYVNGGLFSVAMEQTPPGDAGFRMGLLECGKFDWASISPEIFGSLFQEVLTATERRSLGAHYTSGKNILRLIEPLFLDELREEFKAVRKNEKKLADFRGKLHKLRFLDPACGCGNFLLVTYRELRLLDLEVVRVIRLRTGQLVTNNDMLKNVWLTQFHGLEIKPVSALIAQTALWLTEHQCNRLLEQHFGIAVPTIPLDETPDIRTGNALAMDWESLLAEGVAFTIWSSYSSVFGQINKKQFN